MYPEDVPEHKPSTWGQTKYVVVILSVFFIHAIIYVIHRLWRRGAEQEQPRVDRERSWLAAVYQDISLQVPQQAYVRRSSDVSVPAPLYERHVNDRHVLESVELEQRGKYQYVAKVEDPPEYEGRSGGERRA